MIIDKEIGAAYNCFYKIALSSKFLKFQFDDEKIDMKRIVSLAEFRQNISLHDIEIEKNLIMFCLQIPPSETVASCVYQIKQAIIKAMQNNNIVFDVPIFSSSYFCATQAVTSDISEYLLSLKPSYRSKIGKLL